MLYINLAYAARCNWRSVEDIATSEVGGSEDQRKSDT